MRPRAIVALVVGAAVLHLGLTVAGASGWIGSSLATGVRFTTAWAIILILAGLASRRISGLQTDLRAQRDRHQASLTQIEQLAALNEMLLTLGHSTDVGLAFQSLAGRIGRLGPCDRIGLALLREGARRS